MRAKSVEKMKKIFSFIMLYVFSGHVEVRYALVDECEQFIHRSVSTALSTEASQV